MSEFSKGDIVTNDRYAAMGKSFTYVEYHKTARGGDSHEVRNSGGMPDFFGDDAGLYVVNPAPAPYKKGDRVEMSGNRPGVVGVITGGPWTSGMALVEFPGSHSQTVHVKNLKLAAPVDNSESIGNRNNRSIEPAPFKVGDVVDGIYDVPGHGAIIAEVFDTGHVITTWPNGSRHVEEKRFLKHAKPTKLGAPFPNETRKSDWELNPPSPFKHDNGGPLKAGPTPIINNTGNSIQVLPKPASDVVNHPTHYTSDKSGVECIQITRHRNFAIGSAIKYLWRAGLKQDPAQSDLAKEIEDLQKSIFYIKDEIARLSGEQ